LLDELLGALQYGFIQRALLAGIFIALSCSSLGVFLVLRRYSLIGDGLAHVAFGTIGLGLLLQTHPLYLSAPLVMLASLWISYLAERAKIHGDAAIGMVSALGVSTGVMLASVGRGFNVDLFSYLFGNILAISRGEVYLSVGLSLVVLSVVVLFLHDLFALTFEEEYARVLGIKTRRVVQLLTLCTALTVVLGIRVVGTMLVSSLIVFPAVTALQVARGFKAALVVAALASVGSVIAGIVVSFLLNLPTGATVVYVNFVFFGAAFVWGRWRNR
jgi:zinc transport system permease protein